MTYEVYDKESGAILFKKDEEGKNVDELMIRVTRLEQDIKTLSNVLYEVLKKLESK